MWRGQRQAINTILQNMVSDAKYLWVHAASLGEFEQGRPLIERLRREHPEYKILLTFFSPSGYEVRKNYKGADIICYLPIDTPRNARRFLRAIHPEVAFFIKYEFWYNYLHILKHRGVPVYSVSSIFRENQIFFRWYGSAYARVLRCFTTFFVQTEQSKQLLNSIGIDNVLVTGDTRFDRVLDIKSEAKELPVVERFKNGSNTFVAGSSWLPDEEIFIPFFKNHLDWKLIIAPHVIGEDHLHKIESMLTASDRKHVRYSSCTAETDVKQYDCLIIDCFGLLSSIYKYGEVAYVGGGFGVGIHNLLEAAVWSVPVFFGPENDRFQEAQDLKADGGGLEIADAREFSQLMNRLMADKTYLHKTSTAAGHYVMQHSGALDKIAANIKL